MLRHLSRTPWLAAAIPLASAGSESPSACAPSDPKTSSSGWGFGWGQPLAAAADKPPLPAAAEKQDGTLSSLLGSSPQLSTAQLQLAGVSGLSGYTAGFAIKRTFRVLVFTTGCIFVGLQGLASNGLITVHWDRMEQSLKTLADLDASDSLDSGGLVKSADRLETYLRAGIPSAASFSAGFLLGLRS